ncbi:MAG TPA: putative toxin-antitoxin system toxin component, PIN family, partial [Aggregatilineales bacterium]|nr:putative toxin-antitoxin system toxin component, PIN family [Aggregatilineales bacterium]
MIDTNLIVSAFIWGGIPLILLKETRLNDIEIITSIEIFDELKKVITRSKFINRLAQANRTFVEIIEKYQELVEFVNPSIIPANVIRDPNDIKFLAFAVIGQAY